MKLYCLIIIIFITCSCARLSFVHLDFRTLASNSHAHNTSCLENTRIVIANSNARINASEYRQTNSRSMFTYHATFNKTYPYHSEFNKEGARVMSNHYQGLKEGSTIVDMGSGTGLAYLGMAKKVPHVNVVAVNAQEGMIEHMLSIREIFIEALSNNRPLKMTKRKTKYGSIAGIKTQLLINICNTAKLNPALFGVKKDFLKQLPHGAKLDDHMKKYIVSAFSEVKRLYEEQSNFRYFIGFSEDYLNTLNGQKLHMITDNYGAFFYSKQRLKILDDYYNVLAKGGRAFLVIDGFKKYGGPINIRLRNGNEIDLFEFITSKIPGCFLSHDKKILMIEKKENTPILNLFSQYINESNEITHSVETPQGLSFQVLTYLEK